VVEGIEELEGREGEKGKRVKFKYPITNIQLNPNAQ